MVTWHIKYSPKAENALKNVFDYIRVDLQSPEIATKQTNRIIDAVTKLNTMPHRYPIALQEPLTSDEIHVMPVDNFLVLYKIDDMAKTIYIINVIYKRSVQY